MENFLNRIKNISSKSDIDGIIILGKGPSIDLVHTNNIEKFIVIGINDAERIMPCDFTLFHDSNFIESLSLNGFQSQLYLTNHNLNLPSNQFFNVPYEPLNQGNVDLMFMRLISENKNDFCIEDIIFISALKLAQIIATVKGSTLKTYMLGFDFDPSKGQSKQFKNIVGDSFDSLAFSRITPQIHYFEHALYLLKNSNIDIYHVGNGKFSRISIEHFNTRINNEKKSPSNLLEYNGGIIIVAELTTNHFGDRDRLRKMIELSKSAGANFIKVQKRDVETFYSKEDLDSKYISPFGTTFRDYRLQLELSYDDFKYLDKVCKELDIPWFASVLDKNSFDFMASFNPSIIKIPSTISEHKDFIEYVLENYSGDLVISTGMTDSSYLDFVLSKLDKINKLYLMHTNSSYPTPMREIKIGVVQFFNDLSMEFTNIIPAYSSHDAGSFGSILALAAGAKMIEKHVKIADNNWSHFDAVALDLENGEFRKFVSDIRNAEIAIGSKFKTINPSEHHKYKIRENSKT